MIYYNNQSQFLLYLRDKNSCNFFGTHAFACSNCSAVLVPVLRPIKQNLCFKIYWLVKLSIFNYIPNERFMLFNKSISSTIS